MQVLLFLTSKTSILFGYTTSPPILGKSRFGSPCFNSILTFLTDPRLLNTLGNIIVPAIWAIKVLISLGRFFPAIFFVQVTRNSCALLWIAKTPVILTMFLLPTESLHILFPLSEMLFPHSFPSLTLLTL